MIIREKAFSKYLKIKDKNDEDRPREKLIRKGAPILTKAELLGIIIGSGTEKRTAVDLATQILQAYNNNLSMVAKLTAEELKRFKGIGNAKAALIISTMELASRLQQDMQLKLASLNTPEDTYTLMKPILSNKLTEEFWIILLNNQNRVIKISQISKGGLAKANIDARLIFKQCFVYNAAGIVLVHNHPSGSLVPSNSDIKATRRLEKAAKMLNFKILDHVIITNKTYCSFVDEGLFS